MSKQYQGSKAAARREQKALRDNLKERKQRFQNKRNKILESPDSTIEDVANVLGVRLR